MGFNEVVRLIQLEEGCRLESYKDSQGVWTIGWGYNLEAHGYDKAEAASTVWTKDQADAALSDEINAVTAEIDRRWPKWRELDEVRQAAIVSSVYQLGAPGASYFLATIAAIKALDWDKAAAQMLKSKWATQTPRRVQRNAEMIRTGLWPQEVNGVQFSDRYVPHVAATPAQPAESGMPAGPVHVVAQSPVADQAVGESLPGNGAVTIAGVPVSKKLVVAIMGLMAVLLNQPLGLGMSDADTADLVKLLSSYLVGQSAVDAFKPLVASLLKGAK